MTAEQTQSVGRPAAGPMRREPLVSQCRTTVVPWACRLC